MRFILSLVLILLSFYPSAGQPGQSEGKGTPGNSDNGISPVRQDISGKVFDRITFQPLEYTSLVVKNDENSFRTLTDEEGRFLIEEVPVGRYQLHAGHIGYRNFILRDILIEAGKEFYIKIAMEPSSIMLEDIEITAIEDNNAVEQLSSQGFNMEMSERIAATFYDPARIVTSFSGVAVQNDEANNISVRGNTPNAMSWRIEGLNFVNPNHLTNAGTLSDRPSVNGGGVSVLSAQLLQKSQILTGAFPPQYGNALAGVFDIDLRNGNKNRQEYTLQAGLLGLDAASEGPFSKKNKHSYLANYRYSTIGILSALGVDLGDESLDFQDFSFNLSFDLEKAGEINLFGLGGLSKERYSAPRDSAAWDSFEDRIDTRFDSDMGGLGIVHRMNLGSSSSLINRVGWSVIDSKREGQYVDKDYRSNLFEYDRFRQALTSINSEYRVRFGRTVFTAGAYLDNLDFQLNSSAGTVTGDSLETLVMGKGSYWIHQPYMEFERTFFSALKVSAGVNYLYHSLRGKSMAGPRIGVSWFPDPVRAIRFQYGLVGATQIPQAYYVRGDVPDPLPNITLGLTRSDQFVLGYDQMITNDLSMKLETYYQHHYDVPVSVAGGITELNSFSVVNAQDAFIDELLTSGGEARNMGVELTLDQNFISGFYYLMSGMLYDSKYKTLDGILRNTRFNGQYGLNLAGGKEFTKVKSNYQRVVGINGRFLFHGGFWQTPILKEESEITGRAVYDHKNAFSIKLQDYFRLDAGVYFKKHKKNYTRTILISIQNLTNRKNIAYQYYDREKNEVRNRYQLGIIPSFNYRIEF